MTQSEELYKRALKTLPGGVSRNTGSGASNKKQSHRSGGATLRASLGRRPAAPAAASPSGTPGFHESSRRRLEGWAPGAPPSAFQCTSTHGGIDTVFAPPAKTAQMISLLGGFFAPPDPIRMCKNSVPNDGLTVLQIGM